MQSADTRTSYPLRIPVSSTTYLFGRSAPFWHVPEKVLKEEKALNSSWASVPDRLGKSLPDSLIASEALALLLRLERDLRLQPFSFFLAVGFLRPHLPWVAPASFFDRHALEASKLSWKAQTKMRARFAHGTGELLSFADVAAAQKAEAEPGVPRAASLTLRRAYFAAVAFADHQIGRVLAAIDAAPFVNTTAVAFWSDHGFLLVGPPAVRARLFFPANSPSHHPTIPPSSHPAILPSHYPTHHSTIPPSHHPTGGKWPLGQAQQLRASATRPFLPARAAHNRHGPNL